MNGMIHNPLWLYLLLANFYLFCLMGYDKHQARVGGWRVPELNLLIVGLIGGGLGGLVARRVFRHKTRKAKFGFTFAGGVFVAGVLVFFFH